MANDYRPIQIRFGAQKEQIRYQRVLDMIYSDNMPPRTRSFVIKELLLLAVNTGVSLDDILTGKAHHVVIEQERLKNQPAEGKKLETTGPDESETPEQPKVSKSLADMA